MTNVFWLGFVALRRGGDTPPYRVLCWGFAREAKGTRLKHGLVGSAVAGLILNANVPGL